MQRVESDHSAGARRRAAPRRHPWAAFALLLPLLACAYEPEGPTASGPAYPGGAWRTTYDKYLPRAMAGEPAYETLLGFMTFFGEGADRDRVQAHLCFHRAAGHGSALAARNLAIMHSLGLGAEQDADEVAIYARQAEIDDLEAITRNFTAAEPDIRVASAAALFPMPSTRVDDVGPDEAAYATYCAGCHGLNGIAAYIDSPSFALRERLDKSDAELLHSIESGMGAMPGWGGKLSPVLLARILAFVRTLPEQYEQGIVHGIRRAPELYFLFGPMENDDSAYRSAPLD